MSHMQFGCQFYTWQMSGDKYVGKFPHIFSVVSNAGFAGVESEVCMMGDYYNDPAALRTELEKHGLQLGALCLVCDWREPVETEPEKQEAERLFDYLRDFSETHLVLCQMPGEDRSRLRERQENALACVNTVASRAADRGIQCSFHPNSPLESVFRTEEDYELLLDGLDDRTVGFAPDAGHIANGGMDAVEVFRTYRPLIRHVHFKDIDAGGQWTAMGKGVIDFPSIVTFLHETDFAGWIMVEEESREAESAPDSVTMANGRYVQEKLLPVAR